MPEQHRNRNTHTKTLIRVRDLEAYESLKSKARAKKILLSSATRGMSGYVVLMGTPSQQEAFIRATGISPANLLISGG